MTKAECDLRCGGPCHYCRRAMNWTACDGWCLQVCRHCLGYIVQVGKMDSKYIAALSYRADKYAMERGEPPVILNALLVA